MSIIDDLARTIVRVEDGVSFSDSHYMKLILASIEEIRRLTCRIAKLEAERQWRPIETAPRDGTPILALTRSDLCSRLGRGDLGVWEYIRVVVHYQGVTSSGFDLGWSVSAPVGYGIGRDNWFAGWLPLPATPVKDNVDAQD